MEAVADIADMHINVPNLRLGGMLNVHQKRIFDNIKSYPISQKELEELLENLIIDPFKNFNSPCLNRCSSNMQVRMSCTYKPIISRGDNFHAFKLTYN